MDIDDIADAVEMNIPDVFHDHGSRNRPMRMTEEEFEERILLQLEVDGLSGSPNLPRGSVHFKIRQPNPRIFLCAAPQQSATV